MAAKKKPKERRASFALHDKQGRIVGFAALHIEGFDVPEDVWGAVERLLERAKLEATMAARGKGKPRGKKRPS